MNIKQRINYTQQIARTTPEEELILREIDFSNIKLDDISDFFKNKIKENYLFNNILNFGTSPSFFINELRKYYIKNLKTIKDKLDFLFILLLESCHDEIKNRNKLRIMECVIERIFKKNQLVISHIIPEEDELIYNIFMKATSKIEEIDEDNDEGIDEDIDNYFDNEFILPSESEDENNNEDLITMEEAMKDRNTYHMHEFKLNIDYYDKLYYYSDTTEYNLQFNIEAKLNVFYMSQNIETYLNNNEELFNYFENTFEMMRIEQMQMFEEDEEESVILYAQDFQQTDKHIREDIEDIKLVNNF